MLHQHGHEVRMLLHADNPVITGTHVEERRLSWYCSDRFSFNSSLQSFQMFAFQGFPTQDVLIVIKPAAGLWKRNTSKNIIGGLWSCKHSFYWEGTAKGWMCKHVTNTHVRTLTKFSS